MNYIVREVAPFIQSMTNDRNGWDGTPGIIAFGCSLGATHAANLYFRFPETFDGLLALSGIYTSEYGFPGYMDELVYANSPVDYLAGISPDHPFIRLYNDHKAVVVSGRARGKCRRAHSACATFVRRRTFTSGSTFGATM